MLNSLRLVPLTLAVAAVSGVLLGGAARPGGPQVKPEVATRTVWDGVYSDAQAARGKESYSAHCALCHAENLNGASEPGGDASGTALVGARFWNSWGDGSLEDLYGFVSGKMPNDAPGSLDQRVYLDTLAYMLQANGFPPGAGELGIDAIPGIQIVNKDGRAQALSNFTLVGVVGCLSRTPRGDWVLTSSGNPLKTREPGVSTGEELEAAAKASLGSGTIELADIYTDQSASVGHKMEVKGFFVNGPAGPSVNVTSIRAISPDCGK